MPEDNQNKLLAQLQANLNQQAQLVGQDAGIGSTITNLGTDIQASDALTGAAKALTVGLGVGTKVAEKNARRDRVKEAATALEDMRAQLTAAIEEGKKRTNLNIAAAQMAPTFLESIQAVANGSQTPEQANQTLSDLGASTLKTDMTIELLPSLAGVRVKSVNEGIDGVISLNQISGLIEDEALVKATEQAVANFNPALNKGRQEIAAFDTLQEEGAPAGVAAAASGLGSVQLEGSDIKNVEGRAKVGGLDQATRILSNMRKLIFNPDGSLRRDVLFAKDVDQNTFLPVPAVGKATEDAKILLSGYTNSVNSVFRAESGAAVPEPEVQRYLAIFMPTSLDGDRSGLFKYELLLDRLQSLSEAAKNIDATLPQAERTEILKGILEADAVETRLILRDKLSNLNDTPVKVNSQEDYDNLPSGSLFINPKDNQILVKP